MYLIALCGGSGSGKSTLISLLQERLLQSVSVIEMDNYYISHDELPYDERKLINYDLPESLDLERMMEDIRTLLEGQSIEQPVFSFTTYQQEKECILTEPADILIVDGIFSLHFEMLRNLCDLKVFVDVRPEVRLARRMMRNQRLYNRPLEFEVVQYFDKVEPMHNKYVEPCKEYADLVLPFEKEKENTVAFFAEIIENSTSE